MTVWCSKFLTRTPMTALLAKRALGSDHFLRPLPFTVFRESSCIMGLCEPDHLLRSRSSRSFSPTKGLARQAIVDAVADERPFRTVRSVYLTSIVLVASPTLTVITVAASRSMSSSRTRQSGRVLTQRNFRYHRCCHRWYAGNRHR